MVDSALFCPSCGRKQIVDNEKDAYLVEKQSVDTTDTFESSKEEPKYIEKKPKKKVLNGIFTLVKGSLILLLAIFMVVSLFTPVYIYSLQVSNADIDVPVYSNDTFSMFSFSIKSDVDKKIALQKVEAEMIPIIERLSELSDMKNYQQSTEYMRLLKEYIIAQIRVSDEIRMPITIVQAVFDMIQICLIIAFFILSIFNFMNSFTKFNFGKGKLEKISLRLLIYSAFSYIIEFFIVNILFEGAGKIPGFIVAVIIMAFTSVIGLIIASKILKKQFGSKKKFVLSVVSIFLCSLTAAMALSPVFETKAEIPIYDTNNSVSDYQYITISHDAGFFDDYILTKSEKNDYQNFIASDNSDKKNEMQSSYNSLSRYNLYQIKMGKADSFDANIIMHASLAQDVFMKFAWLYSFIPMAYIFILVCAFIILSEKLMYLLCDEESNITVLVSKIHLLPLCVIAISLLIVMLLTANYWLSFWFTKYTLVISAAMIAMAIFAVATVCIPSGKEKC